MTLPLIILPCSQEKLTTPAKAMDLYQGKGYLPLLTKTSAQFGYEYNLAFMSAKYGLIHASEVIEPYDEKLTAKTVDKLIEAKKSSAKKLIREAGSPKIIACLPKVYMKALEGMILPSKRPLEIIKPPAGLGIGYQRGFLAQQLKVLERSYVDIGYLIKKKHEWDLTSFGYLRISAGDTFRPWVYGVEDGKIFSHDVTIDRVTHKIGEYFTDTEGKKWSDMALKFGLPPELKAMIADAFRVKIDSYRSLDVEKLSEQELAEVRTPVVEYAPIYERYCEMQRSLQFTQKKCA